MRGRGEAYSVATNLTLQQRAVRPMMLFPMVGVMTLAIHPPWPYLRVWYFPVCGGLEQHVFPPCFDSGQALRISTNVCLSLLKTWVPHAVSSHPSTDHRVHHTRCLNVVAFGQGDSRYAWSCSSKRIATDGLQGYP